MLLTLLCFLACKHKAIGQSVSSPFLPTDVTPISGRIQSTFFGERTKLRILQRLPSRLYMNFSSENSLRYESNPFQDPPPSSLRFNFFQSTPLSKITLADVKTLNA